MSSKGVPIVGIGVFACTLVTGVFACTLVTGAFACASVTVVRSPSTGCSSASLMAVASLLEDVVSVESKQSVVALIRMQCQKPSAVETPLVVFSGETTGGETDAFVETSIL
jgi:hypothetical protein